MNIETTFEDYLAEFKKRFDSFLKRAPVFLTYKTTPFKVYIQDRISKKVMEFEIDYEKEVTELIHDIKTELETSLYPVIKKVETVKSDPDPAVISDYMEENECSFEEAFSAVSVSLEEESFLIQKINIPKNQILLQDEHGNQLVYKLKIPVTIYLNRFVRGVSSDPISAYKKLISDGTYQYTVERKGDQR